MSQSTLAPAPNKPPKPSPDFPLFAHATKRWAKKIGGRMVYFGPWDDPEGALRCYQAFVTGVPVAPPEREQEAEAEPAAPAGDRSRPQKPYPEFPLFPHATGRWAKKIRGRLHYFGPWDDPQAAHDAYLNHKDDLHAGRRQRPAEHALTLRDVVNLFLSAKRARVDSHELTTRTWADYHASCGRLVRFLGKSRLVADLRGDDFARYRVALAKKWGPVALGNEIQRVRCLFKFAYEADLIEHPVRFGPGFKRPSKKTLRHERHKKGKRMFEADELDAVVKGAGQPLKAMILLGVNCGFGPSDLGQLPLSALDLTGGWIDFPRPKTAVPRRCKLWPQTVAALREWLPRRPQAKDPQHKDRVFLTRFGGPYHLQIKIEKLDDKKITPSVDSPVTEELAKLLKKLKLRRQGLSFYALRRTFETIAGESRDQVAVDHVMGHEAPTMAAVYRERISDERLEAVANVVRDWLFPKPARKKRTRV